MTGPSAVPELDAATLVKSVPGLEVRADLTTRQIVNAPSAHLTPADQLEICRAARDAKILDIFEGTQQIQLLIIARRLLGKSSAELK